MSEELKPCPFCGQKAELVERNGGWTANCSVDDFEVALGNMRFCPVNSPCTNLHAKPETAARMWNTRPIEDELNERIKELEEEIEDMGYDFLNFAEQTE